MDRTELRKRWIMGTVQPELFYIPWKHKRDNNSIIIKVYNSETHLYEHIKGLRIYSNTGYIYCYDHIVDSEHPYGQSQYTSSNLNVYNYYQLQDILSRPEDDPDRIRYEYGYGMLGLDNDRWIQYPWDYKKDLLKRDQWAMATQYWENPETQPATYTWIANENTPYVQGCEYTTIAETECIMTFSGRETVELLNLPKGQWKIQAVIDDTYELSWTIASYTNGNLYAPDSQYWRDRYINMDYYDTWVEPYINPTYPEYQNENDYYYYNETPTYQPTVNMKNYPYNVAENAGAPEHYPVYYSLPDGTYDTDIDDVHGTIASGWNAPSTGEYINVNSNGKCSLCGRYSQITWVDPRYIEYTEGKKVTPVYNYYFGASHLLSNNTIYYLVQGAVFEGRCNVYQENNINVENYRTPQVFEYYRFNWTSNYGTSYQMLFYEGGCVFEVEYEDGTTSEFTVLASQTTASNNSCYATIKFKKGRNIIRCKSAPFYGGYLGQDDNESTRGITNPVSDAIQRYENDTHTEIVTITNDDLTALKNGTYVKPVFNFYYNVQYSLTIKIKQKSLPPNVVIYDSSYDYCNALEFYVNGQYYGYLQGGIAPVGLALRDRYGRNNIDIGLGVSTQHRPLTLIYYGNNMDDPPVDISQAVIATDVRNPSVYYDSAGNYSNFDVYSIDDSYYILIDMDVTNRDKLTVQSQLGVVSSVSRGYPSTSASVEHTTSTLLCGQITLYQTLSNSTSPYGHANECSYYAGSALFWARMLSNYLEDCNCLNETNGISGNNYNQQYYYLGDGLTKQKAQEFLGCCAFRTPNVEFITE